jgi:hypothetical protein
MRHDKIETTMTYTWILDKEMNTMVKNVDMQHSIPAPMPHLSGIQQPLQTQTQDFDPLKMAQKRLACGEISVREYKKLEKALNT